MKNFRLALISKLTLDLVFGAIAAPLFAFGLRLEWKMGHYLPSAVLFALFSSMILIAVEFFFKLPWRSWRSSGMRDLSHLSKAIIAYGLILAATMFLFGDAFKVPRSIPFMSSALAFLIMGGMRFAARLYSEKNCAMNTRETRQKRVLIVGAGEAGIMIAREMSRHPEAGLEPVGFLDDDPSKRRSVFIGLPVCGSIGELPEVVSSRQVEEILISIPSAEGALIRRIIALARQAKVPYRIVPGVYEVLSGAVSISQIRDVDVADLLGREQVSLDMQSISGYLTGKKVLVTGAGGSIGSEIVRQICGFKPEKIILLGRGENSLFEAENGVMKEYPEIPFDTVVADIRDKAKMRRVFKEYRPQIIFHAAAHKHVPMMEKNPDQAVLNNIGGTRVLVELALEFEVESFVNISTDKAVNPTSVMGATKRIAEMVVRHCASRAPVGCSFVSVRFGNVLGSRGSVIPTFKEQIKRGGPVTVTHPDMTRYFMTIPEAAQLVLQAAALDDNGTVYVLDMGKPVRIKDLAEDLIQLSGFEPHIDIEITYTGIRPGEKLYEEILTAEEGTRGTHHDKIFISPQKCLQDDFTSLCEKLLDIAKTSDPAEIRSSIKKIVPTFNNNGPAEGKNKVEGLVIPISSCRESLQ